MSNIFGCRPSEKISSNLANKIFVPIDKISLSENEDLINAERIGLKYPEEQNKYNIKYELCISAHKMDNQPVSNGKNTYKDKNSEG